MQVESLRKVEAGEGQLLLSCRATGDMTYFSEADMEQLVDYLAGEAARLEGDGWSIVSTAFTPLSIYMGHDAVGTMHGVVTLRRSAFG